LIKNYALIQAMLEKYKIVHTAILMIDIHVIVITDRVAICKMD
jgi:hypothetical protein